jgi:hypothetical protein
MDGLHDLGGRRVLGAFNLDEFRSGIEQVPATDHLASRYDEHWLHAMIQRDGTGRVPRAPLHGEVHLQRALAAGKGWVSPDELQARTTVVLAQPANAHHRHAVREPVAVVSESRSG